MAAQNQIVERLKRQKNQITGMVTPWLHSMVEHKQSQGHTSPVNLPAGIRFRAMGRKMRTLDENRLGSIRPDMVFQLGKSITQRAESTQDLMHFSPTVTREPGIWSEMEQVLPAAQPREASAPADPGVLRQGSVIERVSMFPKPGQSISAFKQQMASTQPGPAEPVERPAPRPRIKPGNRMYTRVQEVVQSKDPQPAAPAESASSTASPATGEAKAQPSREARPAPPSNTVQRAVDHDEPPARSAPSVPARQEPPYEQPKRQPDASALPLAELTSRPVAEAKPAIGTTESVREQPKAAAQPEVSTKPAPAAEPKTDLPRAKAAPASLRLPDMPQHSEPLKAAVPARHAAPPPPHSRPAPVLPPAQPRTSTGRPEPTRVQPKGESSSRPAIPRVFASISRRAQPAAETARPPRIAPKPVTPPAQTIQRQPAAPLEPEESMPAQPIRAVEPPAAEARALPEAKPAPLTEAAPHTPRADTHLPLAVLPARRPPDPQNPLRETLARRALPARQQTQTLRQGDPRPKIAPLVDTSRQPLISPKKYQRSDNAPGELPVVSPQPHAAVSPAVSEIDAQMTRLRQEQSPLPLEPSAGPRSAEPAAQGTRGQHPTGQPASFARTAMPLATPPAAKRPAQTPVLQNSSAAPADKPSTPTILQPAHPPDRAVTPPAAAGAAAGAASMVVQRELADTVSNALQQPKQLLQQQPAQQAGGSDLEALAEQVFPIVKRLIEIEMERLSGGF